MKYRKKPVEIEAERLTAENWHNVLQLFGAELTETGWRLNLTHASPLGDIHYDNGQISALEIHTLEGTMLASYGDYIIKGVRGEYYPCRADIFRETYEECE